MMRRIAATVVVAGMIVTAGSPRAAEPVDQSAEPVIQAAAGVGDMAWQLVRASGSGNAVVSPVSIWEALAMTYAGARGETAAEMAKVLGMPDDRGSIAEASEGMRKLLRDAKGEKIVLDVANRIWLQKGKKLEGEFASLLEGRFNAAAGIVDFVGATEQTRKEINGWVSDHTAGKIDELLKNGAITPRSRLVITNAVYMKAPWETKFEKSATFPESFQLSASEQIDVPFMHQSGKLVAGRVGEGGQSAVACEIPYEGGRLAMIVIVPDAATDLNDVLAGLDGKSLGSWKAKSMRPRQVAIALPKWTARKSLELNEALSAMGMKLAFQRSVADFSGMDGTRDFSISAVLHEGFVDVAEEGTEAAAATAVVALAPAPPPDAPLEIRADRPFAWAVVERSTNLIFFAGIVTNPR